MVFLDKFIFNEKTGWRYRAYTLIDDKARYKTDLEREKTWSIYIVISLKSWLSYIEIQKRYFNKTNFLN